MHTIEIVNPLKTSKIKIPEIVERPGIALDLSDLEIGYADKTVATDISLDVERGEHVAVLGDNGQGKSTLLKTIAGGLESLSGKLKWGSNIKIGYYDQHLPTLLKSEETVKGYIDRVSSPELSGQEVFEMAGNFLFDKDALKKKVKVLSGGEKARLCLVALLLEKNNVLLMDEPTNHLDFETVEALAFALRDTKATVIFVSHNRTFVEILANGIIEVKDGSVRRYHHNYEDYVYHLEQNIESELSPYGSGGKPKNSLKKEERKALKIRLRAAKKELKKVERELENIAEEKAELLKWFEENFKKFSKEKNDRLDYLTQRHEDLEIKWMELELEIDNRAKD